MSHYDKALSTQTAVSDANDLLSDGMFFRHFLLFVYDLCMLVDAGDPGANMWAEHLNHLRRIAVQRSARNAGAGAGGEPQAYILWLICNLDMYAGLMGHGNCDFIRDVVRHNMLPPLEQQIPSSSTTNGPYWSNEIATFPAVLALNQGVVIHTAKLAQAAQSFRAELAVNGRVSSPGTCAIYQAHVSRLQADLVTFWSDSYPDFLESSSVHAGRALAPRVRAIFEHVSPSTFNSPSSRLPALTGTPTRPSPSTMRR